MNTLINLDDVNTKIITIRNQNVILDSDVAALYGVETKRVNEAIRNNLDKFPEGYVFELSRQEWHDRRALIIANSSESKGSRHVVENFDHMSKNNTKSDSYLKTHAVPKAFTEKGLYMLATILKSERATQTTITIVETFAKLRELSNNLIALSSADVEVIEPEIIEKTGGLFNDIFFSGLPTSAETSFEFNLGVMKGKRVVKSESEHELRARQNQVEDILKMQTKITELEQTIKKMNERLENL